MIIEGQVGDKLGMGDGIECFEKVYCHDCCAKGGGGGGGDVMMLPNIISNKYLKEKI